MLNKKKSLSTIRKKSWREECERNDALVPVRVLGAGEEEDVDGSRDLFGLVEEDKLGGAKGAGLGLLGRRGAKDDDLSSHLGGELDGQVSQPAHAHDADPVSGTPDAVDQGRVDRGAGALQRRRVLGRHTLGDGKYEAFSADVVGAKGAVVLVVQAVDDALGALDLATREAVFALRKPMLS